jgi:membrane-associated protease RseP (regulator of RpoE activity)
VLYYGDPVVARDEFVGEVWPLFREAGYDVSLDERYGEFVLVAEPAGTDSAEGVPWTNLLLAGLTVLSTLFAGSLWYHADLAASPWNVLKGWPFVVAIMGVLGVHEFGHYVMSRRHGVEASLPYFIPLPLSFIGMLGAVIRIRGQIPDREALFDIGVAGPVAGLVATVAVTAVGLSLPPIPVPEAVLQSPNAVEVAFGYPPLMQLIAWALGEPLSYADPTKALNPVVFGGWVGMFVTFLNLLPVGQLDGGHIVRSLLGDRQETVAAAVPTVLFGLAAILYFTDGLLAGFPYYVEESAGGVGIWVFWGFLTLVFAYVGPASPIREDALDGRRKLLGVLTLLLGALCFPPVPIRFMG